MSVAELIEQIKALPREEQAIVRDFLLNGENQTADPRPEYLERNEARALGARVMEDNAELFRKLAQ